MERPSMLMDWQNQPCENGHNTKSSHMFNAEIEKNHEIHMETQKISNSQSNSEQKVQCWRHKNSRLQTILGSHNNINSMVLTQKQM
jgi:hypothetical protein